MNCLVMTSGVHFSVMAATEVLGKLATGCLASYLTAWIGFDRTFLSAIVVTALPVVVCYFTNSQQFSTVGVNNTRQWAEP